MSHSSGSWCPISHSKFVIRVTPQTPPPHTQAHVPPFPRCVHTAGMLFFGALGDVIGRRMGSRVVATIMLSGSILLVFTPLVQVPSTYLSVYIFAATW